MSYCKLTICFEASYWIGLVESEDEKGYRVAKHTFGSEPTDPEIGEFIRNNWNELCFTDELLVEKHEGKTINHKRMQRIIAKEIASHTRKGTKAQQALAEQREVDKQQKKIRSKTQREEEKQEKYAKKTEKRKQKHRGH